MPENTHYHGKLVSVRKGNLKDKKNENCFKHKQLTFAIRTK